MNLRPFFELSAMEPWLQKAADAKLLIEKNTRVRSSDGSKALAKAGYTRAPKTRCAHGLRCSGSVGCRGPGPQRVPGMALGRRSALRAVHYRSCGMRLSRSPCARGCVVWRVSERTREGAEPRAVEL